MIIQSIVEEIHQAFPEVAETQIIKDLDLAQKQLAEETDYFEQQAKLDNLSTNFAWTLPSNYNRFKEILLYDINGNPLYLSDYQLAYEIEFGMLFFKSVTSTPIKVMPTGISYMYLSYYYTPFTLLSVTDSFSVKDEYVPAIYSKVYKKYYSRFPVNVFLRGEMVRMRDMNTMNFWNMEETKERIKVKRYVNRRNDATDGSAINYGVAGNFDFTKRMDNNMIILAGSNQIYSKYAKFLVSANVVTLQGDILGFTSCSASLNSVTNQITFTGDFSSVTWVNSNNTDFNVISANSTTIIVEWAGGFAGTFEVVLSERTTI